ncbi:MAG TPA: hypothetical protein VJ813_01665 [Vicinamibacterales bacterium]|nr:hypothetical protein [Vicinamibacterales bacterium]
MSPGRLVLAVFVVLQIADGLISYGAVSIFGITAEGNPLIQSWIYIAGAGPALFGAKLLACGCGTVLYVLHIRRTLAALTVFYMAAAVGPWLLILSR